MRLQLMGIVANNRSGRRAHAWLRTFARYRRHIALLSLLLPVVLVVTLDVALRGSRLFQFPLKYVFSYLAAFVESGVLWGLLLYTASPRRGWVRWFGAVTFIVVFSAALGSQLYFYRQYSTYLNLDATLFATSMADSIFGQLSADLKHFASSLVPLVLVAGVLVWLARKTVRARRKSSRRAAVFIVPALIAALLIPCSYRSIQGSTPDVIYLHAIGGLTKQLTGIDKKQDIRPTRRNPPSLPKLTAKPARARNVLFILTESLRWDLACSSFQEQCPVMPFSNAAVPNRHGFRQARANSSTTAIELAVLWSGLQPNAGRAALHRAPMLFDYAHAAGWETAYWTSQHLLFANSRLYVQDFPVRFHCSASTLDSVADIDVGADDRLLTERVKQELVQLREPFFAVVQYGNTHVPYLVEDQKAPFQPARESKAPEDNEAYRNYYKNAVYRQDETVAELLRYVRGQAFGERTVIVYTADHGEAFREHGQLGHTSSLFDVEIRVPAWIDAPPASLNESEQAALKSYADEPVFHTDFTPTMLDLMGLWDEPLLASYRDQMVGDSLLRPDKADRFLAMTNCAGVWGCAFENWGIMRGWKKLIAREWDPDWLCYNVRVDPEEKHALPLSECQELVREAKKTSPRLPGRD